MVDFRELWAFRELLWVLAVRDIKVRYRQTALGALWAVLQPIMTMLVLWVVFGRLARMPSDGYPYPLFVFTALLPWLLFANAVSGATNSLVGSASLIGKVYFPRLFIPLSSLSASLLDFAVSYLALLGLLWLYGITPGLTMFAILPLLFGLTILVVGLGSLLSALTAVYRDFRLVVPFMLQIWFFATPVIYPAALLPERVRWMLFLNPMAGFVEGFRAAIMGRSVDLKSVCVSLAVAILMVVVGVAYFVRVERRLADVI